MRDKSSSRRNFLKKAAMGSVAVAATAGIAKKVVDIAVEKGRKGSDAEYLSQGDRIFHGREYVEMSEVEKNRQVRMFVDNYRYDKV
ncbi:MAG: twin-arginine translocation signal domain-containing protein [Deltaproteobacteria bacterium]|nr:twin-arginine translocation signal domain-containing protein [Deltaproteobacteria bacterium]